MSGIPIPDIAAIVIQINKQYKEKIIVKLFSTISYF